MADKLDTKPKVDMVPVCGIVMPISEIDGCTQAHWSEVRDILSDAIAEAGFEAKLVSEASEVGLIHQRIIQNLYNNPIVVCDVSAKNPNVMFELGIRLAFDKPTIIVKDDKTAYSFDTGGIEHLEYPRDLRFSQIVEFKNELSEKIRFTHETATSDPDFTTFLKHFGEFKVAKLDQKEVSAQEFILEELKQIRAGLTAPRNEVALASHGFIEGDIEICMAGRKDDVLVSSAERLRQHPSVKEVRIKPFQQHQHLNFTLKPGTVISRTEIKDLTGKNPKPIQWNRIGLPGGALT